MSTIVSIDENTKAWIANNLPKTSASAEMAKVPGGLDAITTVVHRALEVAGIAESRAAEERALIVAKDARTKADAFERGFMEGAQDKYRATAALKAMDDRVDLLTEAARNMALSRAVSVFAMLAEEDPRLQLAVNLLENSSMTAEQINAAVQAVPVSKSRGNEWLDFMAKHHAAGAEPDDMETDMESETAQPGKRPSPKQRAKFLASIGLQPGQKLKSAIATGIHPGVVAK